METNDLDFTKIEPADLPRILAEMNAAMAQHTLYLEKNFASMQSLSQAIKELDATIKKLAKTEEISLQLKQALVGFVEQHINPLYYQIETYSALPSPNIIKHPRLSAGKKPLSNN